MNRTDIECARDFVIKWRSRAKRRRAHLGEFIPVAALQLAALGHPDAAMRRSCLFLLDHHASDASFETFRAALRDPVPFVREAALHGIACERCRCEAICVADVVTDLIAMLGSDANTEVRHKTLVALARFLDRDNRATEAIAVAADSDPDPAIRYIARAVAANGQPHHRGRKAALRDERRARRAN